jgi:hypothetical protein
MKIKITAAQSAIGRRGTAAWRKLQQSVATNYAQWMALGEAFASGRDWAMAAAKTNQPKGAGYNQQMGDWLAEFELTEFDASDRARLLKFMDNRGAIEMWLEDNPKLRLLQPTTIVRKWLAATQPKTPKAATAAKLALPSATKPQTLEQLFAALIDHLQDKTRDEAQKALKPFMKGLSKAISDRTFEREMLAAGSVRQPDGSWKATKETVESEADKVLKGYAATLTQAVFGTPAEKVEGRKLADGSFVAVNKPAKTKKTTGKFKWVNQGRASDKGKEHIWRTDGFVISPAYTMNGAFKGYEIERDGKIIAENLMTVSEAKLAAEHAMR